MTPPLTVEAVGDALRGLGGAEPAGARRVRSRPPPRPPPGATPPPPLLGGGGGGHGAPVRHP